MKFDEFLRNLKLRVFELCCAVYIITAVIALTVREIEHLLQILR